MPYDHALLVNKSVLFEETTPEAIAQTQREEIEDAASRVGMNVECLSEYCTLPPSIVRKRLVELGLLKPQPKPVSPHIRYRLERGDAIKRITRVLTDDGELDVKTIADKTGVRKETVWNVLYDNTTIFRLRRIKSHKRGIPLCYWSIKTGDSSGKESTPIHPVNPGSKVHHKRKPLSENCENPRL